MKKRMKGFTLVELLVVILIIGLLAALLMPAITGAIASARNSSATVLLDQLSQAAKAFEMDMNYYPPGRGDGSKELAAALSKTGPRKLQYWTFKAEQLNRAGHIANPIFQGDDAEIVKYRNNLTTKAPDAHNKGFFDLWCKDSNKKEDGICNW